MGFACDLFKFSVNRLQNGHFPIFSNFISMATIKVKKNQYQTLRQTQGILFYFTNKNKLVLLDFSLNVKAATLIFISGCGSAISSAKEGKSGLIYNLVKS